MRHRREESSFFSSIKSIFNIKYILLALILLYFIFILNKYGNTIPDDNIISLMSKVNQLQTKLNEETIKCGHESNKKEKNKIKITKIKNIDTSLFWGDLTINVKDTIKNDITLSQENINKCLKIIDSDVDDIKRSEIWSQAYQEWYIYHNFFKGKFNGVYLDIGAHKPLSLSNTAFFDLCLGWKGLCVEPSETSNNFENIRSCNIAKHCVWSQTKKLIMIFRSQGDGSLIIDEKEQNRIKLEMPDRVKDLFECDAINANDLLTQYNVKNKYNDKMSLNSDNNLIEIDFISLDVEGAEVEFLKCFPFDRYNIKVWSIEVNKNEGNIDEIMLSHGYIKYDYLSFFQKRLDAIYVKKVIKTEYPWKKDFNEWRKYKRCQA